MPPSTRKPRTRRLCELLRKVILMRPLLCLLLLISLSFSSERYIVTLKIKQSHFTLDVFQHVKDDANTIRIEIPVDKQFYDQIKVGTILNNNYGGLQYIYTKINISK